jgi:transporter family-2 protein
LGQPLPALLVNYVVGTAAVFLYTSIKRVPIPSGAKAFQTPWWEWLGGLFDAVYWLLAIVLASQLDAATLTIKRSARWRFSNDSSALGTRAK